MYTFTVSIEQWASLGDSTMACKYFERKRSAWEKAWNVEKGGFTDQGMMENLDLGSWPAYVIECINYDEKLAYQLLEVEATVIAQGV